VILTGKIQRKPLGFPQAVSWRFAAAAILATPCLVVIAMVEQRL
jgi:hypothetical protein